MKHRIFPVMLITQVLCVLLSGCSNYSDSTKPLTGVMNLNPAPYKLKFYDRSTKAVVLDTSGKEVGRISCPAPIRKVLSRNSGIVLYARKSAYGTESSIYRYKIGDAGCTLITDRQNGDCILTNNLMVCKENPAKTPRNGPSYTELKEPQKFILLDADKGYEQVFATGEYCGEFQISPDAGKAVYMELSKDEYGDYGSFTLKIADISKGTEQSIITSRHAFKYIWCGNDALAITKYDKHNVPTLNWFALDTGRMVPLVTDRNTALIKPDRYNASTGEIYYKAYPTSEEYRGDDEMWVVRPGGKPHKPVPPKIGASPGLTPGMPMPPGTPGTPLSPVK